MSPPALPFINVTCLQSLSVHQLVSTKTWPLAKSLWETRTSLRHRIDTACLCHDHIHAGNGHVHSRTPGGAVADYVRTSSSLIMPRQNPHLTSPNEIAYKECGRPPPCNIILGEPSHFNCSIWLDASQRSWDGVWLNMSAREVKCKSALNNPEDWRLRYIRTYLFFLLLEETSQIHTRQKQLYRCNK